MASSFDVPGYFYPNACLGEFLLVEKANCPADCYNNQFPPPAKRQSPRRLLINCQNSYSNIIKMGYVLAEYAAKARVATYKTK